MKNLNLIRRAFTVDNFIPEVWSARILSSLKKSLVYGQPGVINRDYEGEISAAGDTVRINNIGAVTIGNYTKNTDMSAAETLTDATQSLLIDQAKYFNFQVDDVDRAQTKPDVMDEAMTEAAYGLRDAADSGIAGLYTAFTNTIGTTIAPIAFTTSVGEAYDQLVAMAVLLDEANVPDEGRWVVVPPAYHGILLRDSRFVSSGADAADQRLQNGKIGQAAGFTVLKSNNVPDPDADRTSFKIIAGHRIAWSFAEQINSVEAYRPELRFGDAVKGLHLYGHKVVRPTAGAVLTWNEAGSTV